MREACNFISRVSFLDAGGLQFLWSALNSIWAGVACRLPKLGKGHMLCV